MFVLFYAYVRRQYDRLIFQFAVPTPPEPFNQRMAPGQATFLTDVVPVRLNRTNREVHPLRNLLVCVLFGYKFQNFYFSRG